MPITNDPTKATYIVRDSTHLDGIALLFDERESAAEFVAERPSHRRLYTVPRRNIAGPFMVTRESSYRIEPENQAVDAATTED